MVIAFSIFIAFVIFGGLLGGFIYTDFVTMNPDNWRSCIYLRFIFHFLGVLPFGGLSIFISKRKLSGILFFSIILYAMNNNPIADLIQGPVIVEIPEIIPGTREKFNNLASEYDFTTVDEEIMLVKSREKNLVLLVDDWEIIKKQCEERPLQRIDILEHIERPVYFECMSDSIKSGKTEKRFIKK